MRRKLAVLALLAAIGAWPARCAGSSLWSPQARPLVADGSPPRPGDIVTILVVERSSASHLASHDTDKRLAVGGGPGSGLLGVFPDLSVAAGRTTSGRGTSAQSTTIADRISGLVTEVTPEGALRLKATRRVKLQRDELTLSVSGLVRPDDVRSDNTVLSTEIADLRIESTGRGPIPEKQRPGLISSLLSLLW